MKRRQFLTRIGTAGLVTSGLAGLAAGDDAPETCVTPLQDNDCVVNCSGGSCPDKCCFCICQ